MSTIDVRRFHEACAYQYGMAVVSALGNDAARERIDVLRSLAKRAAHRALAVLDNARGSEGEVIPRNGPLCCTEHRLAYPGPPSTSAGGQGDGANGAQVAHDGRSAIPDKTIRRKGAERG